MNATHVTDIDADFDIARAPVEEHCAARDTPPVHHAERDIWRNDYAAACFALHPLANALIVTEQNAINDQ